MRGNGDDATVGVGLLAQIAADLLGVSASLLSGAHPYSGAALLRQVVEVEYLAWAFANEKRDSALWLNSTHEERRAFFSPARLRGLGGEFNAVDYQHHCEMGGHPVPRALGLLGDSDGVAGQMLLVDLLLHAWRTTDNLLKWSLQHDCAVPQIAGELQVAQAAFTAWSKGDPLYEWSLTAPRSPLPT